MNQDKPYLLDGAPVSARQLMEAGRRYEDDGSGLYFTSQAAEILRQHGHVVANAPEEKQP